MLKQLVIAKNTNSEFRMTNHHWDTIYCIVLNKYRMMKVFAGKTVNFELQKSMEMTDKQLKLK